MYSVKFSTVNHGATLVVEEFYDPLTVNMWTCEHVNMWTCEDQHIKNE